MKLLSHYLSWIDFEVPEAWTLNFLKYDEDKFNFGLELENQFNITWNELESKLSTILGTCILALWTTVIASYTLFTHVTMVHYN